MKRGILIVLVLLVKGGGAYSFDKLIASRAEKKRKTKEYELIEAK